VALRNVFARNYCRISAPDLRKFSVGLAINT